MPRTQSASNPDTRRPQPVPRLTWNSVSPPGRGCSCRSAYAQARGVGSSAQRSPPKKKTTPRTGDKCIPIHCSTMATRNNEVGRRQGLLKGDSVHYKIGTHRLQRQLKLRRFDQLSALRGRRRNAGQQAHATKFLDTEIET